MLDEAHPPDGPITIVDNNSFSPRFTDEQVDALVALFEMLETRTGLAHGSLRLEIMVETPQAILGRDGRCDQRRNLSEG